MASIIDIVNESRKYLDGQSSQDRRLNSWKTRYATAKATLEKICSSIISNNDYFKSNLYVIESPQNLGLSIKSGQVKVPLYDTEFESGFEIHFQPISNGRILVFAIGHCINTDPKHIDISVINEPSELTEDKIIELTLIGLKEVRKTSYLFYGDF